MFARPTTQLDLASLASLQKTETQNTWSFPCHNSELYCSKFSLQEATAFNHIGKVVSEEPVGSMRIAEEEAAKKVE